jgi:hypothetical protein
VRIDRRMPLPSTSISPTFIVPIKFITKVKYGAARMWPHSKIKLKKLSESASAGVK